MATLGEKFNIAQRDVWARPSIESAATSAGQEGRKPEEGDQVRSMAIYIYMYI